MPKKEKDQFHKDIDMMAKKVEVETVHREKEKELPLSPEEEKQILKQIEAEYKASKNHTLNKKKKWGLNLLLFNNQKRNSDDVGDPLLYTIFMTVLASLYQDQMLVEFMGHEEGDDPQAENLNHLAKFDFEEMQKSLVDYVWIWDALFFGRGLIEFCGFDTQTKTPEITTIDPFSFYRDPIATAFNKSAVDKPSRFWGQDWEVTGLDLYKGFYNVDKIKRTEIKKDSDTEEARRQRDQAQGVTETLDDESEFGDNKRYQLIKWHTHHKGKKVLVMVTNDFGSVVQYKVQRNQDVWLAVDRPSSLMSRSWDGVSIPDLLEDKQRKKAILQNVSIKSLEASLFPHYLYNKKVITNPKDLDFDLMKKVGVAGNPAGLVVPMPKDSPDYNAVDFILRQLDDAAQRATATPETQQGMATKNDKTLGEINLLASKAGVRYSLTARLFALSEKNFWKKWYWMYETYMDDKIDKKLVQIRSAFGHQWKVYKKKDIIASPNSNPNLVVTSKILQSAQRDEDLTRFRIVYNEAKQYPGTNHRYAIKKSFKLIGYRTEEIDKLLPPTPDEMIATEENEMLNKDKRVNVKPTDNHIEHIEIHERAKANKSTRAHIETHKAAMALKQEKPHLFPQDPNQVQPGQQLTPETVQAPQVAPENISQAMGMQL